MRDRYETTFWMKMRLFWATGLDRSQKRAEEQNVLPQRLGHFVFVRELFQENPKREYLFGLYQDGRGSLALAKLLRYPSRSLSAYWLRNEIQVYKTLERVGESHPEGRTQFPRAHIPKLLDWRETSNTPLILLEYIDGQPLDMSGASEQARVFAAAIEYLTWLGGVIATNTLFPLKRRSIWHALLMLPLLSVRAGIRFPGSLALILRGAGAYLGTMPLLLKQRSLRFSHRDLGVNNILVQGDNFWILDFQIAALADPLTDLVNLSLKLQDTPELRDQFGVIAREAGWLDHPGAPRMFRALAIYLSIYNLSLRSGRSASSVIDFLREQLSASSRVHASRFEKNLHQLWNTFKKQIYLLMYSSSDTVTIEPFDPKGRAHANALMAKIGAIAPELRVHLIGSVSMGIAGQRDIDIFIEGRPAEFARYQAEFAPMLGIPTRKKKDYLEWEFEENGWEVDILLIDPTSEKFKSQTEVVWAIQNNLAWLTEYEALKLSHNGVSMREYERAKHQFFERIRSEIDFPNQH